MLATQTMKSARGKASSKEQTSPFFKFGLQLFQASPLAGYQQQFGRGSVGYQPLADGTTDIAGGPHHGNCGSCQIHGVALGRRLQLLTDDIGRVGVAGGKTPNFQVDVAHPPEGVEAKILENNAAKSSQGGDVQAAPLRQGHRIQNLATGRLHPSPRQHFRQETGFDVLAIDFLARDAGHHDLVHHLRRSHAPKFQVALRIFGIPQLICHPFCVGQAGQVPDQAEHRCSLTSILNFMSSIRIPSKHVRTQRG